MMYSILEDLRANVQSASIMPERRELIDAMVHSIMTDLKDHEDLVLHFICTHNARRSQLAQVWASVWADHFELPIRAISGGTEASAVHPNVLKALSSQGFEVVSHATKGHICRWKKGHSGTHVFSKKWEDALPGGRPFVAVMTCSEADKECPVVSGAVSRFPLRFKDPKEFDDQPNAIEGYQTRSLEIAHELYDLFSNLKRTHEL